MHLVICSRTSKNHQESLIKLSLVEKKTVGVVFVAPAWMNFWLISVSFLLNIHGELPQPMKVKINCSIWAISLLGLLEFVFAKFHVFALSSQSAQLGRLELTGSDLVWDEMF